MKNTITKALILFVAIVTATSLFASKDTEDVSCSGRMGMKLQPGEIDVKDAFEFKNKNFPLGKKVKIGKLGPQTFYLEIGKSTAIMTLTAENKERNISVYGGLDISYVYEPKEERDYNYISVRCVDGGFF